MDRTTSCFVADFNVPVCPSSVHHCAKQTSGGSCPSNKRHRSLNALARHERIVLPPLPEMTKPGHKKENSSPTSISDWDVNDNIGASGDTVVKKADVDSLEVIFSPRHLAPIRLHKSSCGVADKNRRSTSPSDFVGTRCACSILKERFSFRLRQERLLFPSTPASSSL